MHTVVILLLLAASACQAMPQMRYAASPLHLPGMGMAGLPGGFGGYGGMPLAALAQMGGGGLGGFGGMPVGYGRMMGLGGGLGGLPMGGPFLG